MTTIIWLLIVIYALNKAANTQARTLDQAKDLLLANAGYFVGFLLIVIFLIPLGITYGRAYFVSQWSDVLQNFGDETRNLNLRPPASSGASLPPLQLPSLLPPADAPDPQPTITTADPDQGGGHSHQGETVTISSDVQHIVKRGDKLISIANQYGVTVAEIVAANSLSNPDRITEGQVLLIPQSITVTATPAPTPVPTATPAHILPESGAPGIVPEAGTINLDQAFVEIGGHRLNGDMDKAETALKDILAAHPDNESATRILDEIAAHKQLKDYWLDLARPGEGFRMVNPETELFFNESQAEYVDGLLAGYEFQIVEYEEFWARTANAEVMTIKCITPGWMFGVQFDIQAVHGTKRGANQVADTFKVG